MSSVVYSHALKYTKGDLVRNQEMDHSNMGDSQQHCHHHQQHNSGLIMEMETMLAKLISPNNNSLEQLQRYDGGRGVKKEEQEGDKGSGYNFGSNNNNNESQMLYQHHHHEEQVQGLSNNGSMNGFDGSFNSMALENNTQPEMGSANCSNNYSLDNNNGFRGCDVSNGEATTSSSSGIMNGALNFTTRPSYCNMHMPQIVESGIEPNCVENRKHLVGNNDNNGSNKSYNMQNYFTTDFWDGSAFINASKIASGSREITFSTSKNIALEAQDEDFGYKKIGLTHHLSLPSSSTKMGGMDKLFQIQGSVPCKIRAKRGFATQPRSIAERERRTRISERIKKLQDLFPKSDKQTSTADMLDLAVEYIKDLQKQVKILNDSRAKCTCSCNQKQ